MEFAINRIAQMRSLFHSIKNNFYLIHINGRLTRSYSATYY